MGTIKHNNGREYTIESIDAGKRYRIEEEYLTEFENNNNCNIDNIYKGDEMYKNDVVEYLNILYTSNFIIDYEDADFGIIKKTFNFYTYIGEEFYKIDEEFLTNLEKSNNFEIVIYIVDDDKKIFFEFGRLNVKVIDYIDNGIIFHSSVKETHFYGKIFFDKNEFIKWFSAYYLGKIYDNNIYEEFNLI